MIRDIVQLWLKSHTAEAWLDRRTNFTRSLATMSMIGYILGLGDRHPSNLLLDQITGKVLHIDFGDCFEVRPHRCILQYWTEQKANFVPLCSTLYSIRHVLTMQVAMHREKFPEKIPFRLTRMLRQAMEISGIEGTFRITCESVLRVLRRNRSSVMAMLEAFVYDPLVNWRLHPAKGNRTTAFNSNYTHLKIGSDGAMSGSLGILASLSESGAFESSISNGSYGLAGLPKRPSRDFAEAETPNQTLNERALAVIQRVSDKLKGQDFGRRNELDVQEQVQKLFDQATATANVCQSYVGWCPFW